MGPLRGVKVVEMAGRGPGPFCGMLLSDMGAEVIRVDRPVEVARFPPRDPKLDFMNRGRRSVAVDLKHDAGRRVVLRLIERADALLEGFRPGVMERLGLGPQACLERNPRLVYGRATGWGQSGPFAQTPGHDINYIAVAGVLGAMARRGSKPMPPLNLLGDYAGGGLLLALGVVCALLETRESGKGQVVDAAMVDGVVLLSTLIHALAAMGAWKDEPGSNVYDTGAPYYDVYETADGKFVAVGAIEEKFYSELLRTAGLDQELSSAQNDQAAWPEMKRKLAQVFAARTRDEWVALYDGREACVTPVLGLKEASIHPHLKARGTFIEAFGARQPAPAPRYSRTPSEIGRPPCRPGEHSKEILRELGFGPEEVQRLFGTKAVVREV